MRKKKRQPILLAILAFIIGFPLGIFIADTQFGISLNLKGWLIIILASAVLFILPIYTVNLFMKNKK